MKIRESAVEDGPMFKEILLQPNVLKFFPMFDVREVDDCVHIWEIFCKKGASITAEVDSVACGLAFLNLQGYRKLAHQCLITIIVDEAHRNKGIGTALMNELFVLAKEKFHLEMLHLEVYESNPAINLYRRMGFVEFGFQKNFTKENGVYIGKTMMQREI